MPTHVPRVDVLPLPGPVWLMTALLLVVFTLHVLFMNAAVGGGLWTAWNYFRGRKAEHPYSRRLANELAKMLPVLLAFTVTLGVAALLFVQVLFGNFLYASSILIGSLWLAVIPLVMVAYYGYYYVANTAERGSSRTGVVAMISVLILLCIGFIFSNNMTLMLVPSRWLAMYRAHPNGWNLNLGEPLLYPRYLHIMNGAIAVFSAILAHIGMRKMKTDFEYGRWLVRRGAAVFGICSGIQFLLGLWLLMSVPREIMLSFLRDPLASSLLGLSLISVIASVVAMMIGAMAERPTKLVNAGFGMMVITVAMMVGMRHLLRAAYLKDYANLGALQVKPQIGVIAIFLVLFVAGLATVGYMLALLVKASKKKTQT
ncbi:MAG TPA: hypothetical protein VF786_10195, partial [Terriglobales bacterium]